MNDPWNVKSVRLGNQYTSCIRLHGVPLLPPVLSTECREEMQYYKLLAKEVEKRIAILKPYIKPELDLKYDATDAPDISESDDHEFAEALEDQFENTNNFPSIQQRSPAIELYKTNISEVQESQIEIDFDVEIENDLNIYSSVHRSPRNSPEPDEIPERDCDYKIKNLNQKELITDLVTNKNRDEDFMIDHNLGELSIRDLIPLHQDGPSSLSSKSFTGSLNDINTDVSKQSPKPKLIRQRSYTVLNPSPQLLAHLEVQSFNTGVDMNSISMSESMSKLNQSAKKRKSWDLETAKVKWSSMAMELKNKNIVRKTDCISNNSSAKNMERNPAKFSPKGKSISLSQDRRGKEIPGRTTKSENEHKPKTTYGQKSRILLKENTPSNNASATNTQKSAITKKESPSKTPALVSGSDDPAARVRELYEKLQKQQLMQMASLMEKQKREQQLLQKVFEEQNNILFKQLKTVCPKDSIEIKQAWGDLKDDNDRGPVSLSQLINTSTPDNSIPSSPVTTLAESNSCISKCDSILQKSREITNSLKKPTPKPRAMNGVLQRTIGQVSETHSPENSVKHSPTRNTSRRLNYDTSSDVDPMLTDRTNDTMADLNVTFPSDHSEGNSCSENSASRKIYTRACSQLSPRSNDTKGARKRTDDGIKHLENNIQNSINMSSLSMRTQSIIHRQPTNKELVAATKIVACAKGFLVRRLMRTERVQATVQTIRDALLCALQLHQDREGIRGADVDLHRRLIQQITAACYTLHDTFISSSATERCALIAADRGRRQALATKQPTPRLSRRNPREQLECESITTCQTSSSYTVSVPETSFNGGSRRRFNPRKVPWR